MRVYNVKEFLKLPTDTVFAVLNDKAIGDLGDMMILGTVAYDNGNPISYSARALVCSMDDTHEQFSTDARLKHEANLYGKSETIPLDQPDWVAYGLTDHRYFVVFEREELKAMSDTLIEASNLLLINETTIGDPRRSISDYFVNAQQVRNAVIPPEISEFLTALETAIQHTLGGDTPTTLTVPGELPKEDLKVLADGALMLREPIQVVLFKDKRLSIFRASGQEYRYKETLRFIMDNIDGVKRRFPSNDGEADLLKDLIIARTMDVTQYYFPYAEKIDFKFISTLVEIFLIHFGLTLMLVTQRRRADFLKYTDVIGFTLTKLPNE